MKALIEKLAPPNEEMDEQSAIIVLEQAGTDITTLASHLKTTLEQGVEEMRAHGEDLPPEFLNIINIL